ncbi:MAG TPA: DegT/DnrJ/EryC1/StrS family aminotransferase [Polyangiaceae bacterium]|nr:DegT/DnrJ/EryC1/StrS family aminotransferase [Polyangiaceae bacterium]
MGSERAPADARAEKRVELASPTLGDEERRAVLEVLEGREFVKGPRVASFEREFAAYLGVEHAVATSSGATALLLALLAHGVGHGDEVVVPSFGFFATAAAVVLAGATPVFADIDPATLCLSPAAAESVLTSRTRAVLPVHLFGMPADLPAFAALAERHGLALIEDAAQAHGAKIGGAFVGTSGTAAFSFYATKNMTTLEGGMVLTRDAGVARRLRLFRNHGRDGQARHEVVGGNFRMNEVAAAIGRVQLGRLPAWNERRKLHARFLNERLTGVRTPLAVPGREPVFHQYTVRVEPEARAELIAHLDARGIDARVYYPVPIHEEPAFGAVVGARRPDLPETARACREVLSLPVHPGLDDADLERIVEAIETFGRRG